MSAEVGPISHVTYLRNNRMRTASLALVLNARGVRQSASDGADRHGDDVGDLHRFFDDEGLAIADADQVAAKRSRSEIPFQNEEER